MNRDAYLHYLRDRRARFHVVLDELGLSLDGTPTSGDRSGVAGPSVSIWCT